jgi:hypothetical protein
VIHPLNANLSSGLSAKDGEKADCFNQAIRLPTNTFEECVLKHRPSSTNQLNNQDDQSQHKQNVNVGANHVEADKTEQPQDQKYHEDGPKHRLFSCLTTN